jgi:hypothetical protein
MWLAACGLMDGALVGCIEGNRNQSIASATTLPLRAAGMIVESRSLLLQS